MTLISSRETMFTQPAASREEFEARLNTLEQIANPDNRNLLLNDKLEITDKWGLRWIVKVILKPLFYFFSDPFSDVRMNRVAQNLEDYLRVNLQYFDNTNSLREGISNISDRIITPLKEKTHGRFDRILDRVLLHSNERLAIQELADANAAQEEARQRDFTQQQEAVEALQAMVRGLQTTLQTEEAERQQEVQNLQAALQTEQAGRQQQVQDLRAALQTEQAGRQQEVQNLRTALQTEQAGRQQAVQTLQTALQTEHIGRQQEVQNLQKALQIEQAGREQEVENLQIALQTEQDKRKEEVQNLQTGLQIEQEAREKEFEEKQTTWQAEMDARQREWTLEQIGREKEFEAQREAWQEAFNALLKKCQVNNVFLSNFYISDIASQKYTGRETSGVSSSSTVNEGWIRGMGPNRMLFDDESDLSDIGSIIDINIAELNAKLLEMYRVLGQLNMFIMTLQGKSDDGESGTSAVELKALSQEMSDILGRMSQEGQTLDELDKMLKEMLSVIDRMVELAKAQQQSIGGESEIVNDSNITSLEAMLIEMFNVYSKINTCIDGAGGGNSIVENEILEKQTVAQSIVEKLSNMVAGLLTTPRAISHKEIAHDNSLNSLIAIEAIE